MAVEVTFAAATPAHVDELVATMRREDVEECAALGLSPREAVERSAMVSEFSVTVLFDGEVAAMSGVRTIASETALGPPVSGVFWILTGEPCARHPRAFLKHSRELVAGYLRYCPHLFNYIDARHKPALRMAKWMGFNLGAPKPLGPLGADFIPFSVQG